MRVILSNGYMECRRRYALHAGMEGGGVNGGDLDANPRMSEILDLIQALLDPLVLFKCLGSNFEDPDALEFAK